MTVGRWDWVLSFEIGSFWFGESAAADAVATMQKAHNVATGTAHLPDLSRLFFSIFLSSSIFASSDVSRFLNRYAETVPVF